MFINDFSLTFTDWRKFVLIGGVHLFSNALIFCPYGTFSFGLQSKWKFKIVSINICLPIFKRSTSYLHESLSSLVIIQRVKIHKWCDTQYCCLAQVTMMLVLECCSRKSKFRIQVTFHISSVTKKIRKGNFRAIF